MLKMVDGTGIIGVDMICPLGVSTPQPPNYDKVELEGAGMLVLPNSLDAPLERLELGGKTEQVQTTGKNLFDTSFAKNKENYKEVTIAGSVIYAIELSLKPNTKYAFQCVIKSVPTTMNVGNSTIRYVVSDGQKRVITTNEDGKLYIGFSGNPDGEIHKIGVSIVDIQVEESTTVTPYEPYTGGKPSPSPEYPQEIKNVGKWNDEKQKYEVDVKVTGKNLLNLRNPSVRFDRCILQGDGSIKSDIRSNYYFCSIYVDDPYVVDNIKNDQAITFSIGKGIQNRSITISLHGERVGSVNYQEKSSVPGGNSVSIVPSGFKKVSKIELRFNRSGSLFTDTETVVRDFMIHFGESTPYQPYTEQTMQIALDEPLRGIGEYNDVLTKDGVVMKVKRVVLDGSEDEEWRLDRRFENHINFALVIKDAITVNTGIRTMMDKFKYVRSIWNNDSPGQDMFDAKLRINMPKTLATDLQTFKTWLSQNPLTVDYVLAEPVTEPLPESVQAQLQALHSENGVTHVFVDSGEVPCGIKLTYRKEI